jgi:hypothetical protein
MRQSLYRCRPRHPARRGWPAALNCGDSAMGDVAGLRAAGVPHTQYAVTARNWNLTTAVGEGPGGKSPTARPHATRCGRLGVRPRQPLQSCPSSSPLRRVTTVSQQSYRHRRKIRNTTSRRVRVTISARSVPRRSLHVSAAPLTDAASACRGGRRVVGAAVPDGARPGRGRGDSASAVREALPIQSV